MPSTNKRKQSHSTVPHSPIPGPVASNPPSNGFTYAEGTHVTKKRRVASSNGGASVVGGQEDVEEMISGQQESEVVPAPIDTNASGGLFGVTASKSGNPFSSLATTNSAGMEDGGFEKVMSKDEKRKDKKRKREEKLKLVNIPKFYFDPNGFKKHKVGIAHIRELILHLVTENAAPNWMCIEHRSNIEHVVLLFVPGLQPSHLNLPDTTLAPSAFMPFSTKPTTETTTAETHLPIIQRLFSAVCPTRAPGDTRRLYSVLQALLNAPLSQSEKARRERSKAELMRKMKASAGPLANQQQQHQNGGAAAYAYDPQAFLLTPNQMLDNDYPMPSYMPGSRNAVPGGGDVGAARVTEIGQVRAGNSSVGDDVWLPGSGSGGTRTSVGVAEVVKTAGEALLEKGLSLSDEILGRLTGSSNGKTTPPPTTGDDGAGGSDASASSTTTATTKKAKSASKKRERDGDVVVEVSTKNASDLEQFAVGGGWMETPTLRAGESAAGLEYKVLAIDCEMCLTEDGPELTRATVIDFDTGKVVFDKLCKPAKPVKDYLTQWSGITAEKLATATLTLADVQAYFLTNLITPTTILLGHSLESDLNALKIRHPLCIDTALLYRHPRGQPYKPGLKWLVKQWLGREIQTAGAGGHDSEEDARACVDLLKMKLVQGPEFGEVGDETESIFERMSRHSENLSKPGKTSVICDYGKTNQWLKSKATTAVGCKDDDEVLAGLLEHVGKHDFAFARFMELANTLGWVTNQADPLDDEVEKPKLSVDDALTNLNTRLSKLHASLPVNTALILISGHGDPRPLAALNDRKANFERLYKQVGATGTANLGPDERWTTEDDRTLGAQAEKARAGMGFFCIKSAT